ncbi:MAG: hypothetical protein SFY32_05940 [Bacteroidota bacterium]|nr:hypothetical protein [Bacteroidota bacterium]
MSLYKIANSAFTLRPSFVGNIYASTCILVVRMGTLIMVVIKKLNGYSPGVIVTFLIRPKVRFRPTSPGRMIVKHPDSIVDMTSSKMNFFICYFLCKFTI